MGTLMPIIFYRVRDTTVETVRVLYQRRDFASIFDKNPGS